MIGVAVTLGPAASGYLYTTWGVTAATASIGQVIVAGAISGAVAGYAGGYLSVIATGGTAAEARAAGKSGAISGMLFGAAGGVGAADSVARYTAHATAGCLSAVAGDGKCGRGAISAVFGKYTTNYTNGQGWGGDGPTGTVVRGVATMVAGGVGSVIAGGKFANGAETAAYGYLFNEMLTDKEGRTFKSRRRYYEGDRTLGGMDPGACLCSSDPPTLKEQYEGFKIAATLTGPTRLLTFFTDAALTVSEFLTGNRLEGYKGAGSIAAGAGVQLMLRPLGPGVADVAGHLTGIAYDQVPAK